TAVSAAARPSHDRNRNDWSTLPRKRNRARTAFARLLAISKLHPYRIFRTIPAGVSGVRSVNAIELENKYAAHNYEPLPVVLARGEGAHLWDVDGRQYIDMMSAYSAASHGHAHPRIIGALNSQALRLAVPSRAYFNDRLGPFLREICRVTGLDAALPMNTGAEAVETAIKAARRWGYRVKDIPHDR